MLKITITKGLPASGKSSWAESEILKAPRNSIKRVNKDLLRKMLDASRWSKGSEQFVLKMRDIIIAEALREGKHVIVDDTNFAPFHEERIREIAAEYTKETGRPVEVDVKFFDVSLDEAIERDLKRPNSVGEKVIKTMYNRYLKAPAQAVARKGLEQDSSLPKAIICDLDGTLALLNRDPYDVSKVDTDDLNDAIAGIVKTYHDLGFKVLLLSGRTGSTEGLSKTERWLETYAIPYEMLVMRAPDDKRRDADVKREMFDKNIKGRYYIEFVLDDRDQVVALWRDIGLTCLQVAPGDF